MTSSTPKITKHPAPRNRKLHFPWAGVSAAIAETKAAVASRTLYGGDTGRGLWLVGDQGIYLMSNGAIDTPTIVYAKECDPTKLPFETWWETKRATFGGDDGIEFISIKEINTLMNDPPQPGAYPHALIIRITPAALTFSLLWATPRSPGAR